VLKGETMIPMLTNDETNQALVKIWLGEVRLAVDAALLEMNGAKVTKENVDRCAAAMDQARSKLAYAWNVLNPSGEQSS
jgi:hypothetical protein